MDHILLVLLTCFCFSIPNINSQQTYSGLINCSQNDETGPSSAFLYTCNGQKQSCKSFLIFISQPPYNKISSISNLTSSDQSELAHINNISSFTEELPRGKEIIVPVNCSCSGQYYQANTTFIVPTSNHIYFTVASETYQGLSTCNALVGQNNFNPSRSLGRGSVLKVPLRCACPSRNQTAEGVKFLLTYLISSGDNVSYICKRFNATEASVLSANGFTEYNPTIFPFTTILLPLSNEPLSSQTTIQVSQTPSSSPYMPTFENSKKSRKYSHIWTGIWTGCSVGVFCCVLFSVLLYHKRKAAQRNGTKSYDLPKDFLVRVADVDRGLKFYKYEELLVATENFSTINMITDSVYRGVLNGETVSIKRMKRNATKEANLLKKINHFNVISLLGACEHHGVFYLVYEFMENGSLKDWLQRKEHHHGGTEGWSRRVQIALDVAQGLSYLHNFTDPPYMHKDISSSNILLNTDLRAKISNFSLAVYSAESWNFGSSSVRAATGTKGYMAPEYLEYGLVTPEMDTYAFGVVLLELITGKEAVYMHDGEEVLLVESDFSIKEGKHDEAKLGRLIDPNLQEYILIELAQRMIKLSLACLAEEPEYRPSMAEVVSCLMKIQLDM